MALFFNTILSQAPSIGWKKTYGGTNSDAGYRIIKSFDNKYIIIGETLSDDGDVSLNKGGYDGWIIKLDTSGLIMWEKTFGGSDNEDFNDIQLTSNKGFIIAGATESTNGDITANNGDYDAYIVKLDSLGNIKWQNTYGGSGYDVANSIIQSLDGGYIFAGERESASGITNYRVIKLDSLGNQQWGKTMGGTSSDIATSIIQTTDSGYLVAGTTQSNDGNITGNHGSKDIWIVKLDKMSNIIWKRCYGGSLEDDYPKIIKTNDMKYVILSTSNSDDGDKSLRIGYEDLWLVKIDDLGNIIWEKTYGNASGSDTRGDINTTLNGGFLLSGSYRPNSSLNQDAILYEIDSVGNNIWNNTYSNTSSSWDVGFSAIQTNDSTYLFVGRTGLNFSSNDMDIILFKLFPENNTTNVLYNQTINNDFILYPNPASDIVSIYFNKPIAKNTKILIHNMQGKILPIEINIYDNNAVLNLESIKNGTYMLSINFEGKRVTKSLVITK